MRRSHLSLPSTLKPFLFKRLLDGHSWMGQFLPEKIVIQARLGKRLATEKLQWAYWKE